MCSVLYIYIYIYIYTHKMLIILPSKRDHTNCMLLFIMTDLNKIFHVKDVYM